MTDFALAARALHPGYSEEMMKFGLYLNSQHPERDDPKRRLGEIIEQARLIRALGFDSIWAGERELDRSWVTSYTFPRRLPAA